MKTNNQSIVCKTTLKATHKTIVSNRNVSDPFQISLLANFLPTLIELARFHFGEETSSHKYQTLKPLSRIFLALRCLLEYCEVSMVGVATKICACVMLYENLPIVHEVAIYRYCKHILQRFFCNTLHFIVSNESFISSCFHIASEWRTYLFVSVALSNCDLCSFAVPKIHNMIYLIYCHYVMSISYIF